MRTRLKNTRQQMDNYNLRALLEKSNSQVKCSNTISWLTLQARKFESQEEIEHYIRHELAQKASRIIMERVLTNSDWIKHEDIDGIFYKVQGFWLSYNDILDLLGEAYNMGRLERPIIKY